MIDKNIMWIHPKISGHLFLSVVDITFFATSFSFRLDRKSPLGESGKMGVAV
jgi:hypothetical protein